MELDSGSVMYSFGAGEDISFDVALASLSNGGVVHIFDPTPKALIHFQSVQGALATGSSSSATNKEDMELWESARVRGSRTSPRDYFQTVADSGLRPQQLQIHDVAIGMEDRDNIDFFLPAREDFVSGSLASFAPYVDTARNISVRTRTLYSFQRILGHRRLDVLKLDVGEVEVDVLDDLVERSLGGGGGGGFGGSAEPTDASSLPTVLLVDFDSINSQKHRVVRTVGKLMAAGYDIHHVSGQDFVFRMKPAAVTVNIDGTSHVSRAARSDSATCLAAASALDSRLGGILPETVHAEIATALQEEWGRRSLVAISPCEERVEELKRAMNARLDAAERKNACLREETGVDTF